MEQIKVLAFDTGGTVLDWHAGLTAAMAASGAAHGIERDWHALANEYRRRSLRRMTGTVDPGFNIDDVHLDVLVELFDENKLGGSAEERQAIAEGWHKLDAWPDFAAALRRLLPTIRVMADLGRSTAREAAGSPGPDSVVELGVLGDYRIVREIGRGGMGVVYEAEQVSLGRHVALKVLPRQAAQDGMSLARFQREARASARLHHTNIVPVFEVGQDGETRYYAMQFIAGQSLDAVIDELRGLRSQASARSQSTEENAASRSARVACSRSRAAARDRSAM